MDLGMPTTKPIEYGTISMGTYIIGIGARDKRFKKYNVDLKVKLLYNMSIVSN